MTLLHLLLTLYLYAGPLGILIVFVLMGRYIYLEIKQVTSGTHDGFFLHDENNKPASEGEK